MQGKKNSVHFTCPMDKHFWGPEKKKKNENNNKKRDKYGNNNDDDDNNRNTNNNYSNNSNKLSVCPCFYLSTLKRN